MTRRIHDTSKRQIKSKLEFGINHYQEYEQYERIAVGVHELGNRKVEYIYDLETRNDKVTLLLRCRYYLDEELKNESSPSETYLVKDGIVQHGAGYELEEFVRDNFNTDPEVTITAEFEDMVNKT